MEVNPKNISTFSEYFHSVPGSLETYIRKRLKLESIYFIPFGTRNNFAKSGKQMRWVDIKLSEV